MTKRELRLALPTIPLGANANRLPIVLTLTRQRLATVRQATGINVSTLSQIANGRVVPSPAEQARLAQHFGVTASVLFPEAA